MTALHLVQRGICNVEAESAVIGTILCEPKAIDGLADMLQEEDFADPFLGYVFALVVREHSLGKAINPITLRPYLEGMEGFRDLGGLAWLAELTGSRASVVGVSENAAQIVDLAKRRRLVEGLSQTMAAAADCSLPIGDLVDMADGAINTARDAGESGGEYSAADCLQSVIDTFGQPVAGTECGNIPSLDSLLGPMRPSHLVIGAGRPGMGKTATAISYALGAASRGHGVLFFSLEMAGVELAERMAADLCLEDRVAYEAIRDRSLNTHQQRLVCRARDRLAAMPLQVIDKGGLTIAQLRTRARRWARRYAARGMALELIVVDYLQLLRADGKMDRYEAVSEISRSLKELAKELNVAVFALAQLSRAVEQRPDKRPQLSDLKESGQIEQDADAVIFFLRDEYYLRLSEPTEEDRRQRWEEALQRCQGKIEFICAKRRNGRTGSLTGDFLYHFQAVRG